VVRRRGQRQVNTQAGRQQAVAQREGRRKAGEEPTPPPTTTSRKEEEAREVREGSTT